MTAFSLPLAMSLALGGVLGVWLRFAAGSWLKAEDFANFPMGTLMVNVLGSLLFGIGYAYLANKSASLTLQLGFLVGFCGALTTFSSFAFDFIRLVEQGFALKSLLYLVLSFLGAIGALYVGLKIAGYKFS